MRRMRCLDSRMADPHANRSAGHVPNAPNGTPHPAPSASHLPRPALPAQLTDATLANTEQFVWQTLATACKDRHHGMHTPGIVTIGSDGHPAPRTVVLRRVDAASRMIVCHTDARSEKVHEIEREPRIAWLFYDPQTRIQFRIAAMARIERDTPLAREQWQRSSLSSRRCYLAGITPGTLSDVMLTNVPVGMEGRSPSLAESEAGRRNFAIVVATVLRVDVLELATEGHRRVVFACGQSPTWAAV